MGEIRKSVDMSFLVNLFVNLFVNWPITVA